MDINETKFPNHTWDPELPMEDHILIRDQIPPNPLWLGTGYPLQTHQLVLPSSSSCSSTQIQAANSTILSTHDHNHMEDHHQDAFHDEDEPEEELGAMKEMMYKIAAMQPVDIDPATIRKPKRRNVRISEDPQSVAARHRRERISEKMRILQRLVPGGTKMDTASMLDEAIRYVKFLKRQIRLLQSNSNQSAACINNVEWQVAPSPHPSKTTLLRVNSSSTSSNLQEAHQAAAPGFAFGATNENNNNNLPAASFCFNHEVISD